MDVTNIHIFRPKWLSEFQPSKQTASLPLPGHVGYGAEMGKDTGWQKIKEFQVGFSRVLNSDNCGSKKVINLDGELSSSSPPSHPDRHNLPPVCGVGGTQRLLVHMPSLGGKPHRCRAQRLSAKAPVDGIQYGHHLGIINGCLNQ